MEFQKRGAVHFHLWVEEFEIKEFEEWQNLVVRRQIGLRFKEDVVNLNRFKMLTYLWLKVTGQVEDAKAVRASSDLRLVYSSGFTIIYALKYAWKGEQKEYIGNVNEKTGEIVNNWVGRYWSSSRSVKNVRVLWGCDYFWVRVVRRWMRRFVRRKWRGGLWLMDEEMAGRMACVVRDICRESSNELIESGERGRLIVQKNEDEEIAGVKNEAYI